ncbi:MAG: metal-dependent transcriptional regulator [Flavobacteriaceae bacterium]
MLSHSEENYLKAIFHLRSNEGQAVSTTELSEHLNTKPSSVTDMLQRLSSNHWVDYRKYKGVILSQNGEQAALKIIRKHRLWEVFLVEHLNFNWDEVHEVAEQLEHIQSDQLTAALDRFLNFPKYDPHGDPIPDATLQLSKRTKKLLSNFKREESGVCIGVKDSSADFLKVLDRLAISLGSAIQVIDIEEFDQSMWISVDGEQKYISTKIASNLYLKPTT